MQIMNVLSDLQHADNIPLFLLNSQDSFKMSQPTVKKNILGWNNRSGMRIKTSVVLLIASALLL